MIRIIKAFSMALLVFTLGVVLTPSGTAWARHSRPSRTSPGGEGPDPTPVSACGTLSASDTIYYLTTNITTASTGNCITLSGSHSGLNLYGYNITGPGTGTSTGYGIYITGTMDVVEGFDSTISGFRDGIYDNGTQILGDDLNVTGNVTGLLVGSSGYRHTWTNLSSYSNTGNGIWFNGCARGCVLADSATYDNGLDGLLVQGTDEFNGSVFIAADNGTNGVELGGTAGNTNTDAHIVDAFITGLTWLNPPYDAVSGNTQNGILVDSGEIDDQISTIYAEGNGATYWDLHDANTTCGTDLWYNNTFTTSRAGSTSSPTCIHGMGD